MARDTKKAVANKRDREAAKLLASASVKTEAKGGDNSRSGVRIRENIFKEPSGPTPATQYKGILPCPGK